MKKMQVTKTVKGQPSRTAGFEYPANHSELVKTVGEDALYQGYMRAFTVACQSYIARSDAPEGPELDKAVQEWANAFRFGAGGTRSTPELEAAKAAVIDASKAKGLPAPDLSTINTDKMRALWSALAPVLDLGECPIPTASKKAAEPAPAAAAAGKGKGKK